MYVCGCAYGAMVRPKEIAILSNAMFRHLNQIYRQRHIRIVERDTSRTDICVMEGARNVRQ